MNYDYALKVSCEKVNELIKKFSNTTKAEYDGLLYVTAYDGSVHVATYYNLFNHNGYTGFVSFHGTFVTISLYRNKKTYTRRYEIIG
jgi:hypothetical protein